MWNIKRLICGFFCLYAAILLSACKKNAVHEPTKISDTVFQIRGNMSKMYEQGQQDSAIQYLDKATSKLQLTAVERWSLLNTKTAYFLKYKKRPDSALKYADSLIKVVTNKPDLLNQYISALFVRGDVLMESGLYDDAYVRAGKIAKSSSKCYLLSSKLAMLRYRQGS